MSAEEAILPTPTKFLRATQARVIELLEAGCSRRQAAAGAGISHRTLGRWIAHGERTSKIAPESRFAVFAQAVRSAEAGGPQLLALKDELDRWSSDPVLAWKFLEPELGGREPLRVPEARTGRG